MAAAEDVYFANMGIITVAGTSGTPSAATIALAKDVEATVEFEEVYAYGWGTILIAGRAKHSAKVSVKIGFIKFLPTISAWWPHYILNPTAADGTVLDSNVVKLFTVTAQFTPLTSTNNKLLRTVSNVSFPKFPMKATEAQWVKVDMEGVGSTIVDSNPT